MKDSSVPSSSAGRSNTGSSDFTKNPTPPKVQQAINAQNRRASEVERQARQLFKEGRFEDAKAACYRSLAMPKFGNMAILTLLGDIFQAQGHYQEAIDSYRQSGQNAVGSYPLTQLNIALCYLKMGDVENARKVYDEGKFFVPRVPLTPALKARRLTRLPGTATAKTLKASILLARGCETDSHGQVEEAIEYFEQVLVLVPHNVLAAEKIAWGLGGIYRGEESTPYWARVAVFGIGKDAEEGMRRLKNMLMPDKVEQALAEARKIKE